MNDYVGKICPFCKTEIHEDDDVMICPECGMVHHASCWTENNGCATFACKGHQHQEQHGNPGDVCRNCGTPLGEGQAFCPQCGTPREASKEAPKQNICSKCGAALKPGQAFCAYCGQKVDVVVENDVNSAIKRFNASLNQQAGQKKKKLIAIAGAAVVVVIVLIVVLAGVSKVNLKKLYNKYGKDTTWAEVASDGTYLSIDTNPYDVDDFYISDASDAIKSINKDLGFTDSLWTKMCSTSAVDGRQTDSNSKVTVSWKYHPDRGLSVIYEVK